MSITGTDPELLLAKLAVAFAVIVGSCGMAASIPIPGDCEFPSARAMASIDALKTGESLGIAAAEE